MKKNENSIALTMARALALAAVLVVIFYATPAFTQDVEQVDTTGTDPRAFTSKFMPYYLYTELGNGVKVNQFDLFGMYAFTPKLVMMYDWPLFKDVDYGSLDLFKQTGGLGPFSDVSSGGSTAGFGDLNLRFLYKPDTWTGSYLEEGKSWNLMPGIELNLPTASDDVLGTDTTTVAPMLTFVTDLPGGPPFGLGFLVLMNSYEFDVDEGSAGCDVERFRGRWFWMQPLSRPGPNLGDGLYMLTEFQPVYDFRTDDFDFWFGPEFGKIIKDGQIAYFKPGVGLNREKDDRKFTLEIGYRHFF